MTNFHPSPSNARRQRAGGPQTRRAAGAAETRGSRQRTAHRTAPVLELAAGPVAVQVQIGDRWIAGQALTRRIGPAGRAEILVSHHGHLVWVDQHEIRVS